MTEGPEVVACGCKNYTMAATVRIYAKRKIEIKVKAGIRSENKEQNTAKRGEENTKGKVKAGKVVKEESQINVDEQAQKTMKKAPDDPFHEILAFQTTGGISLLKRKKYGASASTGLYSSYMHPSAWVIDTRASTNIISADVSGSS